MDKPSILKRYWPWLLKVSWSLTSPSNIEDLAQEGLIAMNRALDTYDPTKGELHPYLTFIARQRMREVLRRETWTGSPSQRGHVREKPATPVDTDWDWVEELAGSSPDVLDSVLLGYHQGEIYRALNSLTPEQRKYVFLRFWIGYGGQKGPSLKKYFGREVTHLWTQPETGARDRLRGLLAHLGLSESA